MPTGPSFFTGQNSVVPGTEDSSTKGEIVGNSSKIVIGASLTSDKKKDSYLLTSISADYLKVSDDSINKYHSNQHDNGDTDDDSDNENISDQMSKSATSQEAWPPSSYQPMDPLTLPFGPKTAAARKKLADRPILAHPDDAEALIAEETASTFLIQLPSDLKPRPRPASADVANPADETDLQTGYDRPAEAQSDKLNSGQYDPKPMITSGKLGKLQLFKSGRVQLIDIHGRIFDVGGGMDVAFLQYLSSITMEQPAALITSSSTNQHQHQHQQGIPSQVPGPYTAKTAIDAATVLPTGDLNLMSDITRKLIITPNYDMHLSSPLVSSAANINQSSSMDFNQSSNNSSIYKQNILQPTTLASFSNSNENKVQFDIPLKSEFVPSTSSEVEMNISPDTDFVSQFGNFSEDHNRTSLGTVTSKAKPYKFTPKMMKE